MGRDDRLSRLLRTKVQAAGRTYERARRAYTEGQTDALGSEIPTDADGRAKIVCRRYGERRSVTVDPAGRPSCFDSDHPDCEGCREDIVVGRIETW